MSQKKWQKESEETPKLSEPELVAEVKKVIADQPRQGAEPEASINGYSATFINDKAMKLLNGDAGILRAQNAALKESIFIRTVQILLHRITKLEKDLGG